ncbi:ferritin-like domain-containing protein [Oceaniglobus roseus]|uniref:ferritin-like domain-containing protein n=1 Tax=Oceaniglobus roseus TaxID=1737570 RepID=UPI000C7E91E7|nr:PA2169 family four-helix-bundle protein [Kandeliimicrobium roseum]
MDHDHDFETLSAAHTRTVDAKTGFVRMTDKAEPEFRPVAERFAALHQDHATRLSGHLRRMGVTPDEDGSFMGSVNKAVVTVRSWFDDIDADVMDQVRDGEQHVLDSYDEAIADPVNGPVVDDLRAMRGELQKLLSQSGGLG